MNLFDFWTLPDHRPTNPDCLVVISYTVKDKYSPTKMTKAVIDLAYHWWRKFPQAKLIMSTGDNQGLGIANSGIMKTYALSLGIPEDKIIEEDKSLNTYENLLFCREIINKEGFRQPTVVTLDLHSRRTVAIANKLGWKNFYWISAFSKGDPAYGYKYFQTCSRLTILIYETLVVFYNKLKRQT